MRNDQSPEKHLKPEAVVEEVLIRMCLIVERNFVFFLLLILVSSGL